MERALLLAPSPAYVVDERLVRRNLGILKDVSERAGCRILLAQKAFSMFSLYPLLWEGGLAGTAASGLYEARLGREEMGGEVHVFSPAYREEEFDAIAEIADHVVFNSFAQWRRFGPRAVAAGCSCGLRLNPACSTQEGHAIYDPCAPGSRLGVTAANFEPEALAGIEGFHFHTPVSYTHLDVYKRQSLLYAPLAITGMFVFAALASFGRGTPHTFLWSLAGIASAAAPFGMMLAAAMPANAVAKRLFTMGGAVAGFAGARELSRCSEAVVTDEDVFPAGAAQIHGLKVIGNFSFERVLAYAAGAIRLSGSALDRVFAELLQNQYIKPVGVSELKLSLIHISHLACGGWCRQKCLRA